MLDVLEESEAIRYDPVAAREILKEAAALVESGNYQAAIEQCHRAIAADPLFPSAHNYLGTLYERVGEHDRAVQEYETAMELLSLRAPETTRTVNSGRRASRIAVTAGFIAASTALVMLFVHLIATANGPARGSAIQAQTEPLSGSGLSPFASLKPDPPPAEPRPPVTIADPAATRDLSGSTPAPQSAAPASDTAARPAGTTAPSSPRVSASPRATADTARTQMATGHWDEALRTLTILIDDLRFTGSSNPDLHFDRAQCYEALNRFDEARADYQAARRGYVEWLNSGLHLDTAQRGIATSDRALQRLPAPR